MMSGSKAFAPDLIPALLRISWYHIMFDLFVSYYGTLFHNMNLLTIMFDLFVSYYGTLFHNMNLLTFIIRISTIKSRYILMNFHLA